MKIKTLNTTQKKGSKTNFKIIRERRKQQPPPPPQQQEDEAAAAAAAEEERKKERKKEKKKFLINNENICVERLVCERKSTDANGYCRVKRFSLTGQKQQQK